MIKKGDKPLKGQKNRRPEESPSQDQTIPGQVTEGTLEVISEPLSNQIQHADQRGGLEQFHEELQEIRDKFENTKQFQSVIENLSSEAIIATDKDLNIIQWNKAATALFGWQANEILGPLTSSSLRARILNHLSIPEVRQCLAETGSWTGKATLFRKNGSQFEAQVNTSIIWDKNGNFNGIAAMHCEIKPPAEGIDMIIKEHTEELAKANRILQQELAIHKRTALLAKESEGKNRDLVDNIKLGIFRCTPGARGKFLEVNKAMEEISGFSREELLQIDICDLYVSPEGHQFTNEISISDWKVTRELDLKRKDGCLTMVAVTIVAIRFDSGAIQYFDGILEDITERKQAQQQVQHSLQRLQKTIKEIIEAMAYIGEVRDPYTAGHQRRVAQLSIEIARILGLQGKQYEALTMAAFVHDIGKIMVPADILSKPGKLTKPEFDMLKDHTRIGYEILKTIEFPWPLAKIVLQHHERLDGSGYPSGLSGDQIIIEARILAVADVVEAMSSHRPYRPALGIDKALEEININRGTLYDPAVVDACVKLFKNEKYNLN